MPRRRDLAPCRVGQLRSADAESLAVRLKRYCGLGKEFRRRNAGALEHECQRHCETSGMCSLNQLLRIGALFILEAGSERIRRFGEYAGLAGEATLSRPAGAMPNRCCLTDHITTSFKSGGS